MRIWTDYIFQIIDMLGFEGSDRTVDKTMDNKDSDSTSSNASETDLCTEIEGSESEEDFGFKKRKERTGYADCHSDTPKASSGAETSSRPYLSRDIL